MTPLVEASGSFVPRTILITGASDGIGAAAARQLASAGHRVLVSGRDKQKTKAVADAVGSPPLVADFSRFDEVRALAASVIDALDGSSLDVLCNNAGGVFGERRESADGNELTLQVNHLAPFLLTSLLVPALAPGAAVINTSSIASRLFARYDVADLQLRSGYSPNRAYGNAKLDNLLFTRGLEGRYGDRLSSVAFHPGAVASNFAADSSSIFRVLYRTPLRRLFLISSEQGGSNLAWFAEGTPGSTWVPGGYYEERKPGRENKIAADPAVVDALWDESVALTGAVWP